MIITLKDGSKKEYAEPKSVIDIAFDISEGLARAACAGEVDGKVVDLRTVVDGDCEVNILTAKDKKVLQLFAILHLTSWQKQSRPSIRMPRLQSVLLLILVFIMISNVLHFPVRIWMQSKKR